MALRLSRRACAGRYGLLPHAWVCPHRLVVQVGKDWLSTAGPLVVSGFYHGVVHFGEVGMGRLAGFVLRLLERRYLSR